MPPVPLCAALYSLCLSTPPLFFVLLYVHLSLSVVLSLSLKTLWLPSVSNTFAKIRGINNKNIILKGNLQFTGEFYSTERYVTKHDSNPSLKSTIFFYDDTHQNPLYFALSFCLSTFLSLFLLHSLSLSLSFCFLSNPSLCCTSLSLSLFPFFFFSVAFSFCLSLDQV